MGGGKGVGDGVSRFSALIRRTAEGVDEVKCTTTERVEARITIYQVHEPNVAGISPVLIRKNPVL